MLAAPARRSEKRVSILTGAANPVRHPLVDHEARSQDGYLRDGEASPIDVVAWTVATYRMEAGPAIFAEIRVSLAAGAAGPIRRGVVDYRVGLGDGVVGSEEGLVGGGMFVGGMFAGGIYEAVVTC